MSMPVIVLCVEDLKKLVPHFKKEFLETHKGDMRALLHNLGFDMNYGVEYQELEAMSRTKTCGVVKTDRIVGIERTCQAWLTSSNASHEARIYSEDKSLVKEIRGMTKGSKEVKTDSKEND